MLVRLYKVRSRFLERKNYVTVINEKKLKKNIHCSPPWRGITCSWPRPCSAAMYCDEIYIAVADRCVCLICYTQQAMDTHCELISVSYVVVSESEGDGQLVMNSSDTELQLFYSRFLWLVIYDVRDVRQWFFVVSELKVFCFVFCWNIQIKKIAQWYLFSAIICLLIRNWGKII